MILVTGSTGSSGSLVASLLTESGISFRCMSRREEALEALKEQGYEAVLGDFDRPETLTAALTGCSSAYLVCTPDGELEGREKRFIDAAKDAGVEHIVKLSAFWAEDGSPSPNLAAHARVERLLIDSGMAYTILKPHGFFQTVFWMNVPTIEAQGVMTAPAGSGGAPYLDLRDVAQAVVHSLTDEKHRNQVYDLTGPEAASMAEIASVLSSALGKPIQYVDIPEEQMLGAMGAMGVAESSIAHIATIFRWIREGKVEFTTDDLRDKFNIEPKSWRDFGADLAAGKTGAATSFKPPGPPG